MGFVIFRFFCVQILRRGHLFQPFGRPSPGASTRRQYSWCCSCAAVVVTWVQDRAGWADVSFFATLERLEHQDLVGSCPAEDRHGTPWVSCQGLYFAHVQQGPPGSWRTRASGISFSRFSFFGVTCFCVRLSYLLSLPLTSLDIYPCTTGSETGASVSMSQCHS